MVNGVWQLVLESEWSPNRDTVIPYGITVKTRFGTKPHYPPPNLKLLQTTTILHPKQNPKKQKKTKKNFFFFHSHVCRSAQFLPFYSCPVFFSPFPIQTEGQEKFKLSPLLIKTSRGGNALCIFGLGYYADISASDSRVRFLFVRRFPPRSWRHVVDHCGHCFLSSIVCTPN